MGNFVFALLLLVFCLAGVALRKIYYYLPLKELQRQAEGGDNLARTLWRAVAYENSLRIFLWLWIGLSAAGGFVLLTHVAPWPIAFLAVALLLWIAFAWFPRRSKVSGLEARLAALVTPGVAWLLNYLHPVLDTSVGRIVKHYTHDNHTNLFENSDLVELVERQASQADNRISPAELQRVKQALTAHKYSVRDVLTPRAKVRSVSDGDNVGLVLLDELHASGQSSFPVYRGKTDKIVGTLYLHDLNLKTEGKVRDFMATDVRYLHEDDTLTQALQAFFKTKQQLFVVVNSFEEYVGVLTLEQLLHHLMGKVVADGFDLHHDLVAVANKHAHEDEELQLEEPETTEVQIPEPSTPLTDPEPEAEVVTQEPSDDSVTEAADDQISETEEESDDFAAIEEVDDQPVAADPDDLAALDLPDDEENTELGEGSHVTFEKSKNPKAPQ